MACPIWDICLDDEVLDHLEKVIHESEGLFAHMYVMCTMMGNRKENTIKQFV